MNQFILKNKNGFLLLGLLLMMGGITMSFQDSPFIYQKLAQEQVPEDTYLAKKLPDSINLTIADEFIKDLNMALMAADAQIKRIDITQIQQDVEMALRNINQNGVILKTSSGVKNVEIEKMLAELKFTLKEIKVLGMSKEITQAIVDARKDILKESK